MIKNMKDAEREAAFRVADAMCAAAHTAPKANGLDKIRTLIISGDDIEPLAKEMDLPWHLRPITASTIASCTPLAAQR